MGLRVKRLIIKRLPRGDRKPQACGTVRHARRRREGRREGRGAGAAGRLGEGRGAEAEEGAEDGFAGVVFAAQVGDTGMGGEACGECGGDGGGDA